MAREQDTTRGMSLRELVLELREDVKIIRTGLAKRPTRAEVYGTIGAVLTLVVGITAFL